MIKLSDKWNSNWPNCFKGHYYSKHKGQIIEDIRILEREIESKNKDLIFLRERINKLENLDINKIDSPEKEEEKSYHKCEFWCVKCGFEVIPNQTGILNRKEDCHYCLDCKELKMKKLNSNDDEEFINKKIINLEKRMSSLENNENLNQNLRNINFNTYSLVAESN